MENQTATSLALNKTILWQDHTHLDGYRPSLTMIEYPGKKFSLELNVFGRVTVVPYTKEEQERYFKVKDRLHRAKEIIGEFHGQLSPFQKQFFDELTEMFE